MISDRTGDDSLVTHGNEVHPHAAHLRVGSHTIGRLCAICGHSRPHEQFGGRGERAVICSRCRRRPREKRLRVLLMDEIVGFLDQSNISAKNLRRLEKIESETAGDVAALAALLQQIAQFRPRKRRRWKLLKQQRPDLFHRAAEAGLLDHLELEQLGEYDANVWDDETHLDGWIEPQPWEIEPTAEEFHAACSGLQSVKTSFGQLAEPAIPGTPTFSNRLYAADEPPTSPDHVNLLDASPSSRTSAAQNSSEDGFRRTPRENRETYL